MLNLRSARHAGADIAIDLGTANTLVVERGSGVVFDEPSTCCFKAYDAVPEFVTAGSQAHRLVGRVSKPLQIVRPLVNGVLSDMNAARELLRFATRSARGSWRLTRPRALISVPADATQAERRALTTAAGDAGLSHPRLLDEPLLSAIGIGLRVEEPRGRMIIDCGAGTTEVAVISLGRICVSHSVRGGGEALDRALIEYLHLNHRFLIGTSTAERLKLQLSEVLASADPEQRLSVRGLDASAGAPRTIDIPASELSAIWQKNAEGVVAAVRAALAQTPPELSQDILDDGISLTGGAAMTGLLAREITQSTGISASVAEAPLRSVAAGLNRMLEDYC
jgi:rod shape-determining protein MreB and related proteins